VNRLRTTGIIGAGIAGLTCAQALRRSGVQVSVFEKSRGLGGRVATRRTDSGFSFDHGAQYFTVRDSAFRSQVKVWCDAGAASEWQGRIVALDHGNVTAYDEPRERFVGTPGMNAIARALGAGIDVQLNLAVQSVSRVNGHWYVEDQSAMRYGPYDLLISTAPAPQTQELLGKLSAVIGNQLADVVMDPCWAVMVQVARPFHPPLDAAFVHGSPLGWIARNSGKPGREPGDCWVLHASAAWSRDHLEESPETVSELLGNEFWRAFAQPPLPFQHAVAHRWRYALPREPLPHRYLLDSENQLGAGGDWCGGPRVEGAFLSGMALAEAVLENGDPGV
jgi:renalase